MNEQDIKNIVSEITDAMKIVFGNKWKEAQTFAENEAKKYAQNIKNIQELKNNDEIDEEGAKVLMRMHNRSMKMVLTSLEGISLVLAEKAINAAISAISSIANRLIGWDVF